MKKKKVPQRESNPRPLNLQPAMTTTPQGFIARTKPTYTANLNGHELRMASLAALAPQTIDTWKSSCVLIVYPLVAFLF